MRSHEPRLAVCPSGFQLKVLLCQSMSPPTSGFSSASICGFFCFDDIPTGVTWNLTVVLIRVPFMAKDSIFSVFWVICTFSLEEWQCSPFDGLFAPLAPWLWLGSPPASASCSFTQLQYTSQTIYMSVSCCKREDDIPIEFSLSCLD